MDTFDKALQYTFKNEGSFSNDPHDHGGATSGFGITRDELARWRHHSVSVADVRDMGREEAKAIYAAWYWKPLSCDKITNPGIAICLFDIGVVRGIGVPPKYAQIICNQYGASLSVDGHIGPLTIAAINVTPPAMFIRDFASRAEAGFRSIVDRNESQSIFLKGWINRARRLLTLIDTV